MDDPEILIGIPTLNGPERLERCLRAIKRCTPLAEYNAKVLVADDCSFAAKLRDNKSICGAYRTEMLMADQRVGVAEEWNRLVRHTGAPIQILMNDDVEVVPHWLEALVYSLRENEHAGMVGLKAYQGVTSLQFTPPPIPSYAESVMERGRGMVSSCGYLFGFMRYKWEAVHGFDTQFFAFYEEVDFGIRLFNENWPSYMLSYPIVLHQGGATTTDAGNIDAHKVLAESRAKFRRKHHSLASIRAQIDAATANDAWPPCKQWNTGLSVLVDGD